MPVKASTVNQYEGMFLLGPTGADAEKAVALIRGMIEKHQGQIQVIKRWDERKLAYEIGKQKRGTYVIAFFKATGDNVTTLEREVKLSEDVMRVLITRADHLNEQEMNAVEPQPIAPPPERNPWDRPDGGRGGYDRGPREDRGDRGPREDRAPRGPRREEAPAAAAAAGAAEAGA
ncbi:MAG TPA: 30S ribosomal protein S6, partial [Tepidisphaeraceae bacterium]|nr:30S ribosomal protein S6 [Tepidisphaeraceae bacterium]